MSAIVDQTDSENRLTFLEAENSLLRQQLRDLAAKVRDTAPGISVAETAALAHDLRSPLTSIAGYVDLLLNGDGGELSAIQREFLETVAANALRMRDMIADMAARTRRIPPPTLATPPQPETPARQIALVTGDPRLAAICGPIIQNEGYALQKVATLAEANSRAIIVANRREITASTAAPVLWLDLAPVELTLLDAGATAVLAWPPTIAAITAVCDGLLNVETATVLCISADISALRQLEKTVRDDGRQPVRATLEHDALALARRHHPALILLDARSTGSVAFDTLDGLRSERASRDTPIIALVAPITLPDATSGQPFTRAHLRHALQTMLQSA